MNNHAENNSRMSDDDVEKLSSGIFPPKENPFAVPENYFEKLSGEVMQKISALPDFEKPEADNPFAVPANYFETLPAGIQDRIIREKNRRTFLLPESIRNFFAHESAGRIRLAAVTVSAFAVLLFFGIRYFNRSIPAEPSSVSFTEMLEDEFLAELDEPILVEAFAEEPSTGDDAADESVEEYLIDNDIDLNSIADQL